MFDVMLLLALVGVNAFLSLGEMSVVSSRRAKLEIMAETSAGARAALTLNGETGRFLSAMQMGITLIGVGVGAFGEANLAVKIKPFVENWGVSPSLSVEIASLAAALFAGGLVVIFGELIPKRIALTKPEAIASSLGVALLFLERALSPVSGAMARTVDAGLKGLGFNLSREGLNEEEIHGMLEQGAKDGVFEKEEHQIATRALQLDDVKARAIMTGKTKIVWIDLKGTPEELIAEVADSRYSKIVACKGDFSEIAGFVAKGEILSKAAKGQKIHWDKAPWPAMFAPDSVTAVDLLKQMRHEKQEIALLVDEYGEVSGLVSTTDLLYALVGDMQSDDEGNDEARKREDGSWIVSGEMSPERLNELLDEPVEFHETDEYRTVAGFFLTQLGRLPREGDFIQVGAWRLEVLSMERRKIAKMALSKKKEVIPGAVKKV